MATTNSELDFEFLPFIRVYKNGHVDRLQGTEIVPPGTDPLTGVMSKDVTDIIPGTEVYVRIYIPKLNDSSQKLPVVVYFHGGSFLLFTPSAPLYHDYLNALVAESQVVAVSVHYRRAPEHPLPIAYQDSWDVLQWVASHCTGDGPEPLLNETVDFRRVFLAGDCAGGNIVHNLAMVAGNPDAGMSLGIEGIVLVDPYFNGSVQVGSELADPDKKAVMDKLWSLACPSSLDMDEPWVNPTAEGGLSLVGLGCSRVLVCVAEKDVVKDRVWNYFQVLGRVGWMGMVEIHEAEEEDHCFHLQDLKSEKAIERMTRIATFFIWEM